MRVKARGGILVCMCVKGESEGIDLLIRVLFAGCVLADWLISRLGNKTEPS